MKKTLFLNFLVVALLLSMTSCYVHRHTIGNGPINREANKIKVMGAKKIYLFGGLLGIGDPNTSNPPYGQNGYQIKTSTNGVDMIISFLTIGIIRTRTIKIYVKRSDYEQLKSKGGPVK